MQGVNFDRQHHVAHTRLCLMRITGQSFQSMVTSKGDSEAEPLFLLPFAEVAKCTLDEEIQSNNPTSEQTGVAASRQRFNTCQIVRTGEGPLENGAGVTEHCKKFQLHEGEYVMLRPSENAHRPSIGKVVYFWRGRIDGGPHGDFVRVQWYYRAEDLGERPSETFGEDELFETEHYDDIEVDVIAGRCAVTSYNDWLSTMLRARAETTAEAHGTAIGGELNGKKESQNDVTVEAAEVCDDVSDTHSSFCDNYTSAAVRYYCRKFYDPISQAFATSRVEDKDAEPSEELDLIRQGEARGTADSDDSASFSDDFVPSEDEIPEMTTRRSGLKRKRAQRRRARKSGNADVDRPARAAQFSLPGDLETPATLPCRDTEKEHVRKFIDDAIRQSARGIHGGSRCLYICGVPGTGKTATVREIIRDLSKERAAGELPPFEAVEINAMSLPDPNLVYSELYRAITGCEGFSPLHAAQLLEKRFSDASTAPGKSSKRGVDGPTAREKGKCIILVLDEMDVLVSRKQKILYDVLEWPTRKNARMAVIGISNTLDLPERMLPRLGSRLGVNRVTYPPYTSDQLKVILSMKLRDISDVTYNSGAVNLCATKVGAVSGDVRRALEILRRAGEIVVDESNKAKMTVTATHVHAAIQDISGRSRLATLSQLSVFERLLLVSAVVLARSLGSFAVDVTSSISSVISNALDAAQRNSKVFDDDIIPTVRELEEACFRLAGQRILLIEKSAVFKNSRIIVNVSADDCSFALRDCPLCMKLLGDT